MKILLAKYAGFCWGVKRVIKIIENEINKNNPHIFTHGQLIHNKDVIANLEKKGVKTLSADLNQCNIDNLPNNSSIVIRAHGIPPQDKQKLENANLNVIDGTCPHVLKIQKIVLDAFKNNKTVIILGDKGHAEVIGLLGYCPNKGFIVSNEDDLIAIPNDSEITVVAQSTLDEKTFDYLTSKIKEQWKNATIINTRCDATTQRQNEAINLCKNVDLMLVIGGKNSANTKRLTEICKAQGVNTIHIENADDLNLNDINPKEVKVIGITAGASTPDNIINSVIDKLNKV